MTCGEFNEKHSVVGLNARLVCRAISLNLATLGALMNYNEALFGVNLRKNGFHLTSAGVVAVSGVYVNVERPKTKRAMIS